MARTVIKVPTGPKPKRAARSSEPTVVPADVATDRTPTHAATGKHFLWRVTKGESTAYLMGSVHFGIQNMYPLAAPINEAFEGSDALAVEVDVQAHSQTAIAQLANSKGMYPPGSRLQDHISADTWAMVTEVAGQVGLPAEFLSQYKPWFAAMTLTSLTLLRSGYSEQLGVDLHFLKRARGNKDIIELESFELQMDILNGLGPAAQEAFLRQTVRDIGKGIGYFEQFLDSWRAGDAAALEGEINTSFGTDKDLQAVRKALFTDRNHNMVRRVVELMKDGRTYFVVVGAGHMLGPDGLVQLMRGRGYDVEQL